MGDRVQSWEECVGGGGGISGRITIGVVLHQSHFLCPDEVLDALVSVFILVGILGEFTLEEDSVSLVKVLHHVLSNLICPDVNVIW